MKSIKPGRGPSAMGAAGSIAVAIFGVIWMFGVSSMGAPPFFILFGLVFIGIAVMQAVFHFKNATGRNRMSLMDITDASDEPDPLDRFVRRSAGGMTNEGERSSVVPDGEVNFCPYCGNRITDDEHKFCAKCGKEIR